jgi:predicted TIM-barrel fold metal-dependent hydrolase
MDTYREYLDPSLREEYDSWRASFESPWDDLRNTESDRYRSNFDFGLRQGALEGDGIVGEVIFPNTIPPFFSTYSFLGGDPEGMEDFRRQWAGLRAHNRWLVDFCAELQGRRAGVAQIWLRDLDEALEEIRWIKSAGLFGGILLPIPPPGSSIPPLNAACYEPIWSLCEDLDVPINFHGGGGAPDEGDHPGARAMIFMEHGWYAIRCLNRLFFSGVLQRHPRLKLAITETGGSWVPQTLDNMAWMWMRLRTEGTNQHRLTGGAALELTLSPRDTWARSCWVGASFMGPDVVEMRHSIGVDRLMWGSDFPHFEGTHPYTREALRWTFAGIDPDEAQKILGGNAADLYGFDMEALAKAAAEVGPAHEEIATPIAREDIPEGAECEALTARPRPVGRFH